MPVIFSFIKFNFNYSDQKLDGIFEAASHGQLNANSYAWIDGGAERMPFPAQVLMISNFFNVI